MQLFHSSKPKSTQTGNWSQTNTGVDNFAMLQFRIGACLDNLFCRALPTHRTTNADAILSI